MKKSGVIFEAKKVKPPGLLSFLSLAVISFFLFFTFQNIVLNDPHRANAQYYAQPAPNNLQTAVTIQNMQFTPPQITVPAGSMVIWHNSDMVAHTVTADNNLWDSGIVQPGQSVMMRFTAAGTYPYHCRIHPFMHGSIIVTGSNSPMQYTQHQNPNPNQYPNYSNGYVPSSYNAAPSNNYAANPTMSYPPTYYYNPYTMYSYPYMGSPQQVYYPVQTPAPTSPSHSVSQSQNQSQAINVNSGTSDISSQQNQSQSQSMN